MRKITCAVVFLCVSAIAPTATWAASSDPLDGVPLEHRTTLRAVAAGYRSVAKPHYRVVGTCSAESADYAAKTMELLYYNLSYLFAYDGKLQQSLVFIFANREQFDKYREMAAKEVTPQARGFYSPAAKAIVTYDDGDRALLTRVLMHEGSHQFLFLVAPKAPLWFHEGVAVYLESSTWEGNKLKIGVVPKDRLKHLQDSIYKGEQPRLETLVVMEFGQEFTLVDYGVAWSLVYFFATADQGRYAPRIQKYFKMLKGGSEADGAFYESFAKDFGPEGFNALERRWKKYVLEELK